MKDKPSRALERAEVDRIAALAHLGLTEAEKSSMEQELGKIIAMVAELSELDVEGVAPTTQMFFESPKALRPDTVNGELDRDRFLAEAPRVLEGGFVVPEFVDEG